MLGWLKSRVENSVPRFPVKFSRKDGGESATMKEIVERAVPELHQGWFFYVNPVLLSGHSQTAYTAINKFEKVDLVHYKRRIITVESDKRFYEVDGHKLKYDQWEGESTFAVDYVVPESASDPDHTRFQPSTQTRPLPPRTEYLDPDAEQALLDDDSKPLIIALHGLSGGSYESYIRAVLSQITTEPYGFDAMVINARGCANHTLSSPQLFNGLWTNDIRYLINEHIKSKWPNKRIYLIGFSLGGAILSNYLGQEGDDVYHMIKGAAVLGTPWDFPDSSIQLRESIIGNNVYSPAMCQNLVRLLNDHAEDPILKNHPQVIEYRNQPADFKLLILKDFDDFFTSRQFGFNNADEYYRCASPVQRLHKIRVPTVIISSKDDPITGYRTLPYSAVKINPYTFLVTTTIGGHLGWFKATGGRYYPEAVAKLFCELDSNWTVDPKSVPDKELPIDLNKVTWKYDRIVYGM